MSRRKTLTLSVSGRTKRVGVLLAAGSLVVGGLVANSLAVGGNIGATSSIEIDGNLYRDSSTAGVLDWVKDSSDNVGTNCIPNSDSIATCNEAGVTAAVNGVGHWQGARIVDGVGSGENDIFLKGGKEDDLTSWDNIGAGSVGSAKYDITQAYLANSSTNLYFGMERRGNNGTTAFDFEFNQIHNSTDGAYKPSRTTGDLLFTFEVGSSGGGSVTPHIFKYSGTSYVEQILDADCLDAQNQPIANCVLSGAVSTSFNPSPIPAAPWGFVNSKGQWALGQLDSFEFAEASVNIHDVFGLNVCQLQNMYSEVRTRSAATATSDLKDTTRIFNYSFTQSTAPTISKVGDETNGTVTLSVPSTFTSYQWQQSSSASGTYTAISGATSRSYVYSGWDSGLLVVSTPDTFTVGTDTYVGKIKTTYFKVTVTDSGGCSIDSTPAAAKKIVGFDP